MRNLWILVFCLTLLCPAFISATEETIELSLKDAIYNALKNNIALKIEMITPETYLQTLKMNNADFVPTFTASFTADESNRPSTDIFTKGVSTQENLQLDLGLSQKLLTGGTLSIDMLNTRTKSNSVISTLNPSISSALSFSLTQPLLKGFGSLASKYQIYLTNNDYKKSLHQLRLQIINLVYKAESDYWNLVFAEQNLEAQKMALARSIDLLKENEVKVRVGTSAKIDILEAQAEKARNESSVIQAEQQLQIAEEALKKTLNLVKDNKKIVPVDKPETRSVEVNFNDFLLEALKNRPEMEQARLDLKNYNIRVRYAKNQMLPDLQVTATYYSAGRGGDQLIFEGGNPLFGGRVVGSVSKDIWDTIQDVVGNLYKNYSIRFNLTVPLSFAREKAQLTQAKLNLKRALLIIKDTETTIYSEVKNVIKELEARTKLVEANKVAMDLNWQKLRAEQKKNTVGLSTNFFVITAQNQYLQSQTQDLRSRIDFNLTLAKINQILARTLDSYKIKFKDFAVQK